MRCDAANEPLNRLGFTIDELIENHEGTGSEQFDSEERTVGVVVGEGDALFHFLRLRNLAFPDLEVGGDGRPLDSFSEISSRKWGGD